MKKHLSKRLLSLLLAVVMLFTSAPILATAADDEADTSAAIEYPFSVEYSYNASNDGLDASTYYISDLDGGGGYKFDLAVGAVINNTYTNYSLTDVGPGDTDGATAETGDGFTAYMSSVFINDDDVSAYLSSGSFTVSFDYTPYMDTLYDDYGVIRADWSGGTGNSDGNAGATVIFAVSTAGYGGGSTAVDFIRLLQDGTFEVYNGNGYTSQEFTPELTGTSHNYMITYNGAETVLYIDSKEAATITGAIPGIDGGASGNGNSFYAALGWTDALPYAYKPFGKYESLVFYNTAFSATEAQLGMTLDLSSLESCVSTLEELLGSGDLYLGMAEAFEVYLEAKRLLTVDEYGTEDVTAQLADCLTRFRTAIEDMSLWNNTYQTQSIYTAYFDMVEVGSSIIAASGNTYNLSKTNEGGWIIGVDKNGDDVSEIRYYSIDAAWWDFVLTLEVFGDSYIMLYDGTSEISAPLKYMCHTDSTAIVWNSDKNGLLSVYINNTNLSHNTTTGSSILFTGFTDRNLATYHWGAQRSANYFTVGNYRISTDESYSSFNGSTGLGFRGDLGNSYHWYAYTYVTYTGTPEGTLTTVDPNVVFVDAYGNSTSFGNNGIACAAGTGSTTSSKYITMDDKYGSELDEVELDGHASLADGNAATYYILDISDISEAIDEVSAALAEYELSYFSSDMLDVFKALETAMEYDPYNSDSLQDYMNDDGYVDSDNMKEAAEKLADEIDEVTADIKALEDVVIYNDYDGYEALETALDKDGEIYDAFYGEEIDSDKYTVSSWNTFEAAYQAAVGEINTLTVNNFINQYNENGDEDETVKNKVEALYKAYYGLRQKADFSAIRAVSGEELVTVYDEDGEPTEDTISSDDAYDAGLGGTSEEQNYTYGTWSEFETAYDDVQDFNEEYYVGTENDIAMYKDGAAQSVTVGAFTFTVTPESGTYSEVQQEAIDLTAALKTAAGNLKAPADYSVYNAVTEEIKYQDVGAFAKGSEAALYTLLREQGTQEASVTYSVNGSVEVKTPAYESGAGETAYVVGEDGNAWKNLSDQDTLDGYIAQMITNLNLVNKDTSENNTERATYTVTFYYVIGEGGEKQELYNGTCYYGESFEADPSDYELSGYSVYKWVVTANGNNTTSLPAADTYTAYITSDIEIVAYLSASDTDDYEDKITLKILNLYGNLIQEFYVDENTQITVGRNYITIAGEKYTAENFSWLADTAFYTFDGWQVNGANYNNDSTFTVSDVAENGVVKLKIKMNVADDQYAIRMDNVEKGSYEYDTSVTVTPAASADETQTVYGIAIEIDSEYYVVSYGEEPYTFYVVGNAELFTIYKTDDSTYVINDDTFTAATDAAFVEKLNNQLPFSYSIGRLTNDNDVFTAYSATTANVSVEVTEVGTLYTLSADIGKDSDAFVLETSGVSYITAKNPNEISLQYYLRLSGCSGLEVYTRSYVKYKYTYTTSGGQTISIQTVDYGNIVSTVSAAD